MNDHDTRIAISPDPRGNDNDDYLLTGEGSAWVEIGPLVLNIVVLGDMVSIAAYPTGYAAVSPPYGENETMDFSLSEYQEIVDDYAQQYGAD
jgi:hypothetical protein